MRLGLSQREVADRASLNRWTVMKVEEGGKTRPETRMAIRRVLGLTTAEEVADAFAPDPWMAFGWSLKHLRAGAGFTMQDVADRMGVPVEAVAALERGLSRPVPVRLASPGDIPHDD